MEATGFGVMHVDEQRPHHLVPGKAQGPAGHAGKPDMALASMGIYVFSTQLPVRPAAPRRRRSELGARFRQGHHPLPGEQRQGGRAPLRRSPASSPTTRPRPTGATSARSTPTGRPISTSPTSSRRSTSTTRAGRSGPMPRSRRRPSSSTTRTAGAAWRSTRWSPAAASSPAPACAARCCSPACASTPTPRSRRRWCCPMSTSAATPG